MRPFTPSFATTAFAACANASTLAETYPAKPSALSRGTYFRKVFNMAFDEASSSGSVYPQMYTPSSTGFVRYFSP